HHAPEPLRVDGAELRVFLGTLAGETSPVRTFNPRRGAGHRPPPPAPAGGPVRCPPRRSTTAPAICWPPPCCGR
ncbi:hypothetical protein ACFV6W_41870, partial [Streptomyces sp. NPDC059802]